MALLPPPMTRMFSELKEIALPGWDFPSLFGTLFMAPKSAAVKSSGRTRIGDTNFCPFLTGPGRSGTPLFTPL